MQRGEGPYGPTQPYAETDGRIWVPPKGAQPSGEEYRVLSGKFKGWAIYPDQETYHRLLGRSSRVRVYRATGDLWERRLTVYQSSPRAVAIYFRGRHASGRRAADVARDASDDEPGGLLTPSASELAEVKRRVEEAMNEQLVEAVSAADASFRARTRLSGLKRTASKLLARR